MATTKPGFGKVRPQRQCFVISIKSFAVALEGAKNVPAPKPSVMQIRSQGKRLVIGRQGFAATIEVVEGIAATEPRVMQIGIQRESLSIRCQGFVVTLKMTKRIASINVGIAEIGFERDGPLTAIECIGVAPEMIQYDAAVAVGLDNSGLQGCNLVIEDQRLREVLVVSATIRQDQQRFNIVRIDGDGCLGALARLGALALLQQDNRQIGQNGSIGRRQLQSGAEPLFGFWEFGRVDEVQRLEKEPFGVVRVAHDTSPPLNYAPASPRASPILQSLEENFRMTKGHGIALIAATPDQVRG